LGKDFRTEGRMYLAARIADKDATTAKVTKTSGDVVDEKSSKIVL